uniref:DNA repair and recombination protein RAD54-like n=1 Tax=Romanomermis culicivorax TaxID=13658 RepID=A0A915KJ94_ROMCU
MNSQSFLIVIYNFSAIKGGAALRCEAEFGIPITQGGYANASETQVRTAYKCACALREIISPYLLRRTKSQVKNAINLPSKSEQVLFCRLTDHQRHMYRQYLESRECQSILKGSFEIFVGLINLRKLCNHPDLITGGPNRSGGLDETIDEKISFGHWQRSGKMIVVKSLLKLWKEQNHKVLLFSQSRKMLNILEVLLKDEKHTFLRMDGSTAMSSRQIIVERYNNDEKIFCFLLTTRVGGLGINLTAADRVIIYDPDWNPSTDSQAKERAWRIGQTKPVTVYRLLTSGTIEEKIYHRQIFKQFLTNRILKDPKQRRFFKTNDLYELFTLTDKENYENKTETGAIFADIGSEVNFFDKLSEVNKKEDGLEESDDDVHEYRKNNMSLSSSSDSSYLRNLAKKLSKQLAACKSDNYDSNSKTDENCKQSFAKKLTHGAKFENDIRIPHLVKQRRYKTSQNDIDDEKKSRCDDNYVLNKLFKKSIYYNLFTLKSQMQQTDENVHSAMTHDKIVEADNPDYALIEAEAEKVAKNAVKALSECRQRWIDANRCFSTRSQISTAIFKPRFGPRMSAVVDVTPKKIKKTKTVKNDDVSQLFSGFDLVRSGKIDTPSTSSTLLTKIKMRNVARNHTDPNDEEETNEATLDGYRVDPGVQLPPPVMTHGPTEFSSLNNNHMPKYADILTELRNFVEHGSSKSGRASTKEIIQKFGNRVALQDSAVFKNLLNRICDFSREADGQGVWLLKSQFM